MERWGKHFWICGTSGGVLKELTMSSRGPTIPFSHDLIHISIWRSRFRYNSIHLMCWTRNIRSIFFQIKKMYIHTFCSQKKNNSEQKGTICCAVSKYILVQNIQELSPFRRLKMETSENSIRSTQKKHICVLNWRGRIEPFTRLCACNVSQQIYVNFLG